MIQRDRTREAPSGTMHDEDRATSQTQQTGCKRGDAGTGTEPTPRGEGPVILVSRSRMPVATDF